MGKKRLGGVLEFSDNLQVDPAAGYVRIYNDVAGRARLHRRIVGHRASFFQSHFGRVRIAMATAQGDNTVIDSTGAAFSVVGTIGAVNTDSAGGFVPGMRRVSVAASSSSSAVAGLYAANAQWTRGDAAGKGGFYMAFRWSPGTGQASTTRGFCGVTSGTSAPTDAEPSTQVDVFGMGWDTADTKINIMRRTGSGTVQKYATSFNKPTTSEAECYQLEIYAYPPYGGAMAWRLECLSTGDVDGATYTSDLPDYATFLAPRIYESVAGVTGAVGVSFMNFYGESDV